MTRLALVLVVVFVGASTAETEEATSNYQHLRVLDPFLGPWVYEGPLKEDIPGFAEKGTLIRVPFEYRWAVNKNALIMDWSIQVKGQRSLDGVVLIGWDPKEKDIIDREFTSDGGYSFAVWTVEGNTLRIKDHVIAADGTETTSVVLNKLTEQRTMIWQATNQVRGGTPLPDSAEYEFQPMKR
jgi:hypothetical protein